MVKKRMSKNKDQYHETQDEAVTPEDEAASEEALDEEAAAQAENREDENQADAPDGGAEEDAQTKYLRLFADFQNFKKRTEKERFERYSEGKKDFAADLLPVIDNFERALGEDAKAANDEHDAKVLEGMQLIFKQLLDVLTKNGVEEIPALGEDFDPNVHHAVIMEPSAEYASQKVSEVLQNGYRQGEKVIRPAMVKVAE
jgi:molecular chaperone GrpE